MKQYRHCEEVKRRISENQTGKPHPHKGYKFSDETKRKISAANKGKKLSEETKNKISFALKGKSHSVEHNRKVSEALKKLGIHPSAKGLKWTEEQRARLSNAMKKTFLNGRIPHNRGKPMSIELKMKLLEINRGQKYALGNRFKHTEEARRKISISHIGLQSGKKHPNWKGGITPANQAIRNSTEYKQWRKAVFERDNYTCLICGQIGGELNAHHIKPFNEFPELRFVLSNGVSMCIKCHKLNPL